MVKKVNINQVENQIKSLTEKWKRALADYANLEKRVKSEKRDFVKFYNAGLLEKLLGVLESLEKAEIHLKDKGLSLALDQFRAVLKDEGIEEIKAQGEKFSPETMDCIEIVKGPKDKVIEVVEKGYYLNSRVLRPVKVRVGSPSKNSSKS